jgi:hypothetical protein
VTKRSSSCSARVVRAPTDTSGLLIPGPRQSPRDEIQQALAPPTAAAVSSRGDWQGTRKKNIGDRQDRPDQAGVDTTARNCYTPLVHRRPCAPPTRSPSTATSGSSPQQTSSAPAAGVRAPFRLLAAQADRASIALGPAGSARTNDGAASVRSHLHRIVSSPGRAGRSIICRRGPVATKQAGSASEPDGFTRCDLPASPNVAIVASRCADCCPSRCRESSPRSSHTRARRVPGSRQCAPRPELFGRRLSSPHSERFWTTRHSPYAALHDRTGQQPRRASFAISSTLRESFRSQRRRGVAAQFAVS